MKPSASELLADLNRQQRQAASHQKGPLLVLAGAGTGKTRVITYRIANLLAHGIRAENILALTFTRKAGDEMLERVGDIVGPGCRRMRISTFHSLGLSILRDHPGRAGLPRRFGICDDAERLSVAEETLRQLDKTTQLEFDASRLLDAVSRAKNGRPSTPLINQAAKMYDAELRRRGLIDFDDMVALSLRVLELSQAVRSYYQQRYRYLLVDEYQDTNSMQHRLLRCLLGPEQNIFVVGDDAQSIYSFRGAVRELICNFCREFPAANRVMLRRNYRCSREVVRLANAVIGKASGRLGRTLKAELGPHGHVELKEAADERGELAFIARRIATLHQEQAVSFKDIAVLVRLRSHALAVRAELSQQQIPVGPHRGGVNVLTLHSAKGLEFPVVIIPGLDDDNLPHWNAVKEGQDAIEEELRLFYVGITRAGQQLVMTYCTKRRGYAKNPSRFLKGLWWKRLLKFQRLRP